MRISTMRLALLIALAGFALAPGARADGVEFDSAIGKTGTGRCHMDSCSFFSIQTSQPIAILEDGTMLAISELSWSSEYKRHGDDDTHEYDRAPVSTSAKTPDAFVVFCSKTRPYYMFDDGHGAWESVALRPGDEAAVFGASESAYMSYWAACHHFIAKEPVSAKMAAKLGYRFSGGSSSEADDRVKKPADLLK